MPPKRSKKELFKPKELVLAKMHGFPAWPSFVMPLELVPEGILQAKKKTTNFCVIFIPDGDFYWMSEKNLESLSEDALSKRLEKITSKGPKKKTSQGRTINVNDALLATKDLEFDEFMKQLDLENSINEEEEEDDGEEEEEEEEEIVEGKFNGEEADDEPEDEEIDKVIEDDHEDVKASRNSKDFLLEKPLELTSLRNSRSLKRNNQKLEDQDKRNGKRSKITIKDERPSTPSFQSSSKKNEGSPRTTSKEERQQQLWLCRIKLQRTLIQRNQPVTPSDPKQFPPPTPDELLVARLILHRLVDFPMTLEFLKSTKIHKVLKCILRNKDLEYPDSFKLHEKCNELLDKWAEMLHQLKIEKAKEIKAINGHHKDFKNQASIIAAGEESEFSSVDTSLPLKSEKNNSKVSDTGEEESEDINESIEVSIGGKNVDGFVKNEADEKLLNEEEEDEEQEDNRTKKKLSTRISVTT